MSKACDAVTDYWFFTLNFPVMRVPKAVANTASRRISEKQGMRVVAAEDRDYVSGRFPAEIWRSRLANGALAEVCRSEIQCRQNAGCHLCRLTPALI
jgi:RimJ/RimL family protein N-acetyltransferase